MEAQRTADAARPHQAHRVAAPGAIAAGMLVLLGIALAILVSPWWVGLAAFVGAGLTFAGATGWCGMAKLLQVMPWNRVREGAMNGADLLAIGSGSIVVLRSGCSAAADRFSPCRCCSTSSAYRPLMSRSARARWPLVQTQSPTYRASRGGHVKWPCAADLRGRGPGWSGHRCSGGQTRRRGSPGISLWPRDVRNRNLHAVATCVARRPGCPHQPRHRRTPARHRPDSRIPVRVLRDRWRVPHRPRNHARQRHGDA